jgi:hypothetical protein
LAIAAFATLEAEEEAASLEEAELRAEPARVSGLQLLFYEALSY